jgi:hypothetical protein
MLGDVGHDVVVAAHFVPVVLRNGVEETREAEETVLLEPPASVEIVACESEQPRRGILARLEPDLPRSPPPPPLPFS